MQPIALPESRIARTLFLAVVNECTRLLDEGVVLRASDIDVGMVLGFGFPAYRYGAHVVVVVVAVGAFAESELCSGGVMHWAMSEVPTARQLVSELQALRKQFQHDLFRASPYLQRRAADRHALLFDTHDA
jgi:hypothetical protein